GGLDLGHGHPEPTVADERDDRPVAMDECRGDRGGEPVAHGPGRRAEERPRPAEAKAPTDPAREVACIRGQDRVVWQDAPQGRDRPPGMEPPAVPGGAL